MFSLAIVWGEKIKIHFSPHKVYRKQVTQHANTSNPANNHRDGNQKKL